MSGYPLPYRSGGLASLRFGLQYPLSHVPRCCGIPSVVPTPFARKPSLSNGSTTRLGLGSYLKHHRPASTSHPRVTTTVPSQVNPHGQKWGFGPTGASEDTSLWLGRQ